jgi:hypothetical protein
VDSIAGLSSHDVQYLFDYVFGTGPVPYCPPYPPDSILPVTADTLEVRDRVVPPGQRTQKVDLWLSSRDTLEALAFAFGTGARPHPSFLILLVSLLLRNLISDARAFLSTFHLYIRVELP